MLSPVDVAGFKRPAIAPSHLVTTRPPHQADLCRTSLEYLNQAVAERDDYAKKLDQQQANQLLMSDGAMLSPEGSPL